MNFVRVKGASEYIVQNKTPIMIDIKQIKLTCKLFGTVVIVLAIAAMIFDSDIVAASAISATIVFVISLAIVAIDFFVERSLKK